MPWSRRLSRVTACRAVLITAFLFAVGLAGPSMASAAVSWSSPAAVDPEFSVAAVSCARVPSAWLGDHRAPCRSMARLGHRWGSASAVLVGVVRSDSFCVAVDDIGRATAWNGTSWATPATVDDVVPELTSVSCASASFCVAVSQSSGETVIFDGSSWSEASSNAAGFQDISCPSSTFCAAVIPPAARGPSTEPDGAAAGGQLSAASGLLRLGLVLCGHRPGRQRFVARHLTGRGGALRRGSMVPAAWMTFRARPRSSALPLTAPGTRSASTATRGAPGRPGSPGYCRPCHVCPPRSA